MSDNEREYFYNPNNDVFGYSYSRDEVEAAGDSWAMMDYRQNGGYVFGWWASEGYSIGEVGSNHISRLVRISKETFDEAEANGWKPFSNAIFVVII